MDATLPSCPKETVRRRPQSQQREQLHAAAAAGVVGADWAMTKTNSMDGLMRQLQDAVRRWNAVHL
jgi:predicted SpoU family rRNA methylase